MVKFTKIIAKRTKCDAPTQPGNRRIEPSRSENFKKFGQETAVGVTIFTKK